MPRRVASSVDSESESADSLENVDNRPILVKRERPKILGVPVTAIMMFVYMSNIAVFILDAVLILGCSYALRGGYVITIMFGLLGPITFVYWGLSLIYIVYGARALFIKQEDFWQAASAHRRWTRISLYLLISMATAFIHVWFGARMFVYATSMEYHIEDHMRKNNIKGNKREAIRFYSKIHDEFILSDANMHNPFPWNVLTLMAMNWGLWIPLAIILPIGLLYLGVLAQEAYYNWRYSHTGIRID